MCVGSRVCMCMKRVSYTNVWLHSLSCAGWHLFISVVHEITVFPYHVCLCVCVGGFTDGVIHKYLVALSSCSAPGHLFAADAHEIRVFLYEML